MIFKLSNPHDRDKAKTYFSKLYNAEADIEIKRMVKPRTVKQNKYLHALFAIFGNEFGYTVEEAKILIKRELKYTYTKSGQVFLKHTSEMSVDELSRFINRFRTFSEHLGCYLPSAEEYRDNYVEIMKQVSYAEAR